ncbi:MAG: zinc-binding loop region of homing endonuclease [Bacteriophage sp.]|jgi:hypothetical protein|nr:MAG: zinc-binding loop region of homing endonuclease [Bacteriophage sp.]UWF83747.1 MAG: zinc-binding loop region of homing endonuclease [Bacteriophage sp.]WAX11342.1 hypothetical protein CB473P1_00055 [Enterocloster phage CB473P1]
MFYCDICKRPLTRKIKSYGYTLCPKHYKQQKKYGKFLDNNPRTLLDKNEYFINGEITTINLYDKNYEVIAKVIIDTEDLSKVKNIKWKLSSSGYAMNTPKYKGSNKHMTHVIMEIEEKDVFIDHINHNKLDNRKSNLRIVTKSQNQMNVNYKGVSLTKDNKYYAHIKINQKMLNLGTYIYEEEAYWARWYAEKILFKEYRYPKEEPQILKSRKEQIKEYVNKKVQRL